MLCYFLPWHVLIQPTQDFYASYPGFEPFGTSNSSSIFQDAVRKELAQVLGKSFFPVRKSPACY